MIEVTSVGDTHRRYIPSLDDCVYPSGRPPVDIRRAQAHDGQYLWQPGVDGMGPGTFCGEPVTEDLLRRLVSECDELSAKFDEEEMWHGPVVRLWHTVRRFLGI